MLRQAHPCEPKERIGTMKYRNIKQYHKPTPRSSRPGGGLFNQPQRYALSNFDRSASFLKFGLRRLCVRFRNLFLDRFGGSINQRFSLS
jgi:hypothetical protein